MSAQTPVDAREPGTDPGSLSRALGARLRAVRQARGLTLRQTASELDVSASFLSQIETGKSQPSVSTLYSLSRLLGVSVDVLFDDDVSTTEGTTPQPSARDVKSVVAPQPAPGAAVAASDPSVMAVSRSELGAPATAWRKPESRSRLDVRHPGERKRIVMDSGVVWEQLVDNTGPEMEFLEVIYAPHSSSTNDDRMLRHEGFEYGYILEGALEVTFGFEVLTLVAGDSFGFDSDVPHLFRNISDVPVRFISFNRHS